MKLEVGALKSQSQLAFSIISSPRRLGSETATAETSQCICVYACVCVCVCVIISQRPVLASQPSQAQSQASYEYIFH